MFKKFEFLIPFISHLMVVDTPELEEKEILQLCDSKRDQILDYVNKEIQNYSKKNVWFNQVEDFMTSSNMINMRAFIGIKESKWLF